MILHYGIFLDLLQRRSQIMRNLIIIFSLLMPISAFSLTCPNNGSMLKAGDSIQEVTERCGEAISSNNFTNTKIISGEWIYYITNTSDNNMTKMTVLHDRGRVANINIFLGGKKEKNVQSTKLCNNLIQIGDTMNYVQSVCDKPTLQNTLQTESTEITELKYEGMSPNILIFENNKLSSWK